MKIVPDIPIKFVRFPESYINDVSGWAYDKKTIDACKGKLLTLDIDFGSCCSLNCPVCFRKNNSIDNIKHELQYDDIVDVILQAKQLGLRSVKFLGAGEPLENFGFLEIIRFLKTQNIIPLIFTKGQVIGNDDAVSHFYGDYGINTSKELVIELKKCNASILLGFNSFDDKIQAQHVGNSVDFVKIRNQALSLLVQNGFNDTFPTRLALINSPVTNKTINEAFDIYRWGRLRNIYTVVAPSMISGRANNELWKKYTPTEEQLITLYVNIYRFNIETNLQTINQIIEEGISAYAGAHPCNQVSAGLYVSLNGKVLSCPGSEDNIEGNYWDSSLKEIWEKSQNYQRSGTYNCGCIVKDGRIFTEFFYEKILNKLRDLYAV
jgi:MoaA/NifB/PqqE/SkfB family radical SAM enzyme